MLNNIFLIATGMVCGWVDRTSTQPINTTIFWHTLYENKLGAGSVLPFAKVIFSDELHGTALAISSTYITSDGGRTWKSKSSFGDVLMKSMIISKSGMGWAVGEKMLSKTNDSVIFESKDGGERWSQIRLATAYKLSEIEDICVDEKEEIWIGAKEGVLKAKLQGEKIKSEGFYRSSSPVTKILCSQSGAVWAAGRNGFLAKFDQNGWRRQRSFGSNTNFTQIVKNGPSLWLIGHSWDDEGTRGGIEVRGKVYESVDAGESWVDLSPANSGGLNDISFASEKVWLVGNEGQIYFSINGGKAWERYPTVTKQDLRSIFFLDSKTGWIAGGNQTILKMEKRLNN